MKKFNAFILSMVLLLCAPGLSSAYTVVFMGDSITRLWRDYHQGPYFTPNDYLGKGIDGQVTTQMIARFQSDVLNYNPKVVVIMAGTNDIARNNGYTPHERIVDNILFMASMAREAGAKVAVISVPPADSFWWNTALKPADDIRTLNTILAQKVMEEDYLWIDLYSAIVGPGGSIDSSISDDAIHPVEVGYELIEQIVQPYLEEML